MAPVHQKESRRIFRASGILECAANCFPDWIVNTVKVSRLIHEALRSDRNEIDLPDTLHHRDEVGDQPNDSNQHSRNQRFHRTCLQYLQSMPL